MVGWIKTSGNPLNPGRRAKRGSHLKPATRTTNAYKAFKHRKALRLRAKKARRVNR